MLVGFVLATPNLDKVLGLTEDRQGVRMFQVESTMDLYQTLCLSDRTEIKNVYQRLKEAELVGDLEVVNVARLYKRFY